MRTVKLEDLKKLAATSGSDEVLVASNSELFTAPLSTVLSDYSTQASLDLTKIDLAALATRVANIEQFLSSNTPSYPYIP